MRPPFFLVLLAVATFMAGGHTLRADITINTQFAGIFAADGLTGIGAGRIGLLVADEGAVAGLADPFGTQLAVGNYLGGTSDDRILAVLTSAANVGGTGASGFQELLAELVYGGNFEAGDELYLMWFPTIALVGSTVEAGVSYGAYRSDVRNAASGADTAFFAPADGSTVDLFANLASLNAPPGGGITAEDFTARFVAVPEPSALWLLGAGALGWLAWRVRRRAGRLALVGLGGLVVAPASSAQ